MVGKLSSCNISGGSSGSNSCCARSGDGPITCGIGEKFSSTELPVSTVVDGIDVTGVGVTSMIDSTSIVDSDSTSVVDCCVDVCSIVLVGGIAVVGAASDVTGVDIVDVVVGKVVDDDDDIVVGDDVVVEGVVGTVAVVCSMGADCNIIGAGIINCTIDGDGCIMPLGIIGICAFKIGNSGMGGVRKICEFWGISGCLMIQ